MYSQSSILNKETTNSIEGLRRTRREISFSKLLLLLERETRDGRKWVFFYEDSNLVEEKREPYDEGLGVGWLGFIGCIWSKMEERGLVEGLLKHSLLLFLYE